MLDAPGTMTEAVPERVTFGSVTPAEEHRLRYTADIIRVRKFKRRVMTMIECLPLKADWSMFDADTPSTVPIEATAALNAHS